MHLDSTHGARALSAQVIAQNERLALGSRALGGGANRLEDFFPFDPIQLKRCAKLINPLFQTWVPPHGSSEPRDSNFTGTSLETGSEYSPGASDSLARSLQVGHMPSTTPWHALLVPTRGQCGLPLAPTLHAARCAGHVGHPTVWG